jgi:flagellar biosynthetic protein FliR
MVQLFGQVVVTGVQMALPVMAALLITDLTLGLLARVAPNIQVSSWLAFKGGVG